ncbi:hypothetical protein [Rhodopseudomonas sp. B29]|uniref:hypothetical protein n=1 Tax=Rhodopseudomonas sp. B29 TaxID=95607 RepID=UPI0003468D7D|nr:hypothetical protein [Rhodopseudomonas sp. B29]
MKPKKSIDIEKLVQWAMREELPKGRAVSASPWDLLMQHCALGVRVDTSFQPGEGLGFVGGDPHPDALIVAAAVRALDTEARFASYADAEVLFGEFLPIAGDAVAAITVATFDPRGVVISSAVMGSRPKWKFELPAPRQRFYEMPNARGEVRRHPIVLGTDAAGDVVMLKKNRGRAWQREGDYSLAMSPRSPIEWHDPVPLKVADARAEYVAWHRAMITLAHNLHGALADYQPTPPAAPALPWLTGEPASRVICGAALARFASEGRPLAPKRPAGERPTESPIKAESVASYNRASRTKIKKTAAAVA